MAKKKKINKTVSGRRPGRPFGSSGKGNRSGNGDFLTKQITELKADQKRISILIKKLQKLRREL